MSAHGGPNTAYFTAAQVQALLPMGQCIDTVAEALRGYSAGTAVMPVRSVTRLPLDDPEKVGILSTMPCYMGDYCACKTITVFPGNSGPCTDCRNLGLPAEAVPQPQLAMGAGAMAGARAGHLSQLSVHHWPALD